MSSSGKISGSSQRIAHGWSFQLAQVVDGVNCLRAAEGRMRGSIPGLLRKVTSGAQNDSGFERHWSRLRSLWSRGIVVERVRSPQ